MFTEIVGILFGICIYGGLFVGIFLVSWFALCNPFFHVLNIWFPKLGVYRPIDIDKSDADRKTTKKLAIDMLIASRQAKRNESGAPINIIRIPEPALSNQNFLDIDGDLTETFKDIVGKISAENPEVEFIPTMITKDASPMPVGMMELNLEEGALFHLARIHESKTRFLCIKLSTRDGLRTGWAALPAKSVKLDFGSAERLSQVLPGSRVLPANALARQLLRNKFQAEGFADVAF